MAATVLHFVFIWSGKFYCHEGKVREFCTLMSVATMTISILYLIDYTYTLLLIIHKELCKTVFATEHFCIKIAHNNYTNRATGLNLIM